MKYALLAASMVLGAGLLAAASVLGAESQPLWACPPGTEPIQYLEAEPSGQSCGVPTSACLRSGAPSAYYHFLCPARPTKSPQQCPAGQRLQVLPADDSPWIACSDPLPNCVSLDPPRNSIFDCRKSQLSAPAPPQPVPVVTLPVLPEGPDLDEEASPAPRGFWAWLLDAIVRLFRS